MVGSHKKLSLAGLCFASLARLCPLDDSEHAVQSTNKHIFPCPKGGKTKNKPAVKKSPKGRVSKQSRKADASAGPGPAPVAGAGPRGPGGAWCNLVGRGGAWSGVGWRLGRKWDVLRKGRSVFVFWKGGFERESGKSFQGVFRRLNLCGASWAKVAKGAPFWLFLGREGCASRDVGGSDGNL